MGVKKCIGVGHIDRVYPSLPHAPLGPGWDDEKEATYRDGPAQRRETKEVQTGPAPGRFIAMYWGVVYVLKFKARYNTCFYSG